MPSDIATTNYQLMCHLSAIPLDQRERLALALANLAPAGLLRVVEFAEGLADATVRESYGEKA